MIRYPLRRAANLSWHKFTVDKVARSAIKGHRPAVLWFTGLSGSGKSTIADNVEKRLLALGRHTYTLDGDNVRHGLNRDLGFTDADRVENIRRVIETAPPDRRCRIDRVGLVHLPVPRRTKAGTRASEGRQFHGDLRRRAARRMRTARSEGPLPQGTVGQSEEFHRHRLDLRAAGRSRYPYPYRRDGRSSRKSTSLSTPCANAAFSTERQAGWKTCRSRRRRVHQSQPAATMSRAKAIGPCGAA